MKKIFIPGIVAGIAMLIIGMGLSYLFNAILPQLSAEYENTSAALFRAWEDPLMSLYFIYPILTGLVLAWAWNRIKDHLKGDLAKKAVNFGLGYFLVATIPGMLVTYASFQISLLMVLSWTISSLVNAVVASLILAKLNK